MHVSINPPSLTANRSWASLVLTLGVVLAYRVLGSNPAQLLGLLKTQSLANCAGMRILYTSPLAVGGRFVWSLSMNALLVRVLCPALIGLSLLFASGRSFAQAPPADTGAAHAEPAHDAAHLGHDHAAAMGAGLQLWTLLPFVLLLLSIAVFPLTAAHWWEHNKNKALVVAVLSVPLAIYLVTAWGEGGVHQLVEKGMEYLSFLLLLGSLFVISGGIYVQGSLSGTPLLNTGIMGLGAILASFIGTTGASMVLIRPILRANASRSGRAHIVVFFIFVVSNCGGLLTPLGDPPLFLGFLKGVPFEWTLQLWPQWLLVNGLLLVIFNVWDQIALNREERERPGSQLEQVMQHEPLRVKGLHNLLFLGGIVATIYAAGRGLGNGGQSWPFGIQEGLMFGIALASYLATSASIRSENRFGFSPIIEVAVLFAGIFVTMIPALLILNANGASLGVNTPAQFFWATGILSSFLDNAPTYLTFAATSCGMLGVPLTGRYLEAFLAQGPDAARILAAISCGAVFMGANTYIGNGPNFMVKAIAEENGVPMPSFFGYMLYSLAVLIPIFILVTIVFFL